MTSEIFFKDPDETIIATMDWTTKVDAIGTTISTSSYTVPAGITKVSDSIVAGNKKTSVKLSGGTAGTDYVIVNTVTLADTQIREESGIVRVRSSAQA